MKIENRKQGIDYLKQMSEKVGSQAELARLIGISPTYMSMIMKGHKNYKLALFRLGFIEVSYMEKEER